jgi:hypothetical protein
MCKSDVASFFYPGEKEIYVRTLFLEFLKTHEHLF